MPEIVKLSVFTSNVEVKVPVLFGAKVMVNETVALAARLIGSDGNWETVNGLFPADTLMLEIGAALVPVF